MQILKHFAGISLNINFLFYCRYSEYYVQCSTTKIRNMQFMEV